MPGSTLTVGGRKVPVSNLEKVLYPGGRFTKAQVIHYYTRVSSYILPHLMNRPVTLKRYPNGVFGEFFYEKDAPSFTPAWVKRFPVPRREGGPKINYIVINNLPTLVWVANTASLELHPFLHRAPKIDTPTYVVFDLDPGEGADILTCAEVAFLLKELFEGLEMKIFPKVSGSKGIQIYVPLNTPVTYDSTQPFARTVAETLARRHPKLIVSEMSKALRRGKVFIDWSQNATHKTTVAVYSLRAKRERPYVSMPVEWHELEKGLAKKDTDRLYFEANEAIARVKEIGDLFAPVLKLKQRIPKSFALAAGSRRRSVARESNQRRVVRSLEDYATKRNFRRTSEPRPELPRRSAQGSRRRFVVQKHAASHLHYDLRLEMHNTLKSWSVPKGLSLIEDERRSAIATEDHPIDYLSFEGTIPQGEYGGGTVMVWDIGTYEILEGNYYKGMLVVFLNGQKLKGEWTIERADDEGGKTRWLVVKTNGNAKPVSAKRDKMSALSGRTLDEITETGGPVWRSNRPAVQRAPLRPAPTAKRPGAKAPEFVAPMKPTLVDKLPEGEEWLYEVKWDGYRALGLKHGDRVQLLSLKNKDLTSDFPRIAAALRAIHAETALLDGEIVAVDKTGRPSFQVLQNRATLGRDWRIVYYAFDLLNLEGRNLLDHSLDERRTELSRVVSDTEVLFNRELPGRPEAILRQVKKLGLEGVVAKRRDSRYESGRRSLAWLKVRLDLAQEFVIGGYNPAGGNFQSLLVGYCENGKLMFAGKVRQGFTPIIRAQLLKIIKPFESTGCPFANLPTSRKSHFGEGVTAEDMAKLRWVKPKLVAHIRFAEWTSYGLLRHATFVALRDDKRPEEVKREKPRHIGRF